MASQRQRMAAKRNVRKAIEEARRRNLPGRSRMGRDDLARALRVR